MLAGKFCRQLLLKSLSGVGSYKLSGHSQLMLRFSWAVPILLILVVQAYLNGSIKVICARERFSTDWEEISSDIFCKIMNMQITNF